MPKHLVNLVEARSFLSALFGAKPPDLHILLWSVQGKGEQKVSEWFRSVDRAAERAAILAESGKDVYVGVGLAPRDFGPYARCKEADVAGLVALWIEVDVADRVHAKVNLPPTIGDALTVVRTFPLPPSILVRSAHGLHVWWLLRRPWVFADDAERWRAKETVVRLQETLRTQARHRGWTIDATADLARVLRVAGTVNYKAEPVPVGMMDLAPGRCYDVADFLPHLVDLPKAQRAPGVVGEIGECSADVGELRGRAARGPIRQETLALLDSTGPAGRESASEADAALAAGLVAAGLTDAEVLRLIAGSPRGRDALTRKGKRGDDYLRRTVAHAASHVGPVIETAGGLRLRYAGRSRARIPMMNVDEARRWPN